MTPLALTFVGVLILPLLALSAASRQQRWFRLAAFALFASSLALLWIAAWQLDQVSGASMSWVFCGCYMVTGAALSFTFFVRSRSWFAIACSAPFLAAVLFLRFVDLTPAKPYFRFQAAIRNGMTRTEVETALNREFAPAGRFPAPAVQQAFGTDGQGQLILYPEPTSGPLVLFFQGGRLFGYVPDRNPFAFLRKRDAISLILGPWLAVALCFKELLRLKRNEANHETNHGIDARPVLDSLRDVRCDYFTAHHASPRELSWRRRLLASARHAISQLPYFKGHS